MRKGGKRMSETNTRVKREDDSMGGERAAWDDMCTRRMGWQNKLFRAWS
jgi:hypothetical protein